MAHSNRRTGLNVDDGPMPDGNTETTFYAPRTDPADANSAVVADFTGLPRTSTRAARSGCAGGTSG